MASMSRILSLPDLRNLLVIRTSHKENKFPKHIRNSSHGICASRTQTDEFYWSLEISGTFAHHSHTQSSNISQRGTGISPQINDDNYLCLKLLSLAINTKAVSSCFFTCNIITVTTMHLFRDAKTSLLATLLEVPLAYQKLVGALVMRSLH